MLRQFCCEGNGILLPSASNVLIILSESSKMELCVAIHSCSMTGVNKTHRDCIYLCRAADNTQHTLLLPELSSNAPVLPRRWKKLIRCYLLLLLLGILPLHPPCCSQHRCAAHGHGCRTSCSSGMFCYLAQPQRGCCWQGRAEQAAESSGLSC